MTFLCAAMVSSDDFYQLLISTPVSTEST